jgi:hypothetical protein
MRRAIFGAVVVVCLSVAACRREGRVERIHIPPDPEGSGGGGGVGGSGGAQ